MTHPPRGGQAAHTGPPATTPPTGPVRWSATRDRQPSGIPHRNMPSIPGVTRAGTRTELGRRGQKTRADVEPRLGRRLPGPFIPLRAGTTAVVSESDADVVPGDRRARP